MFILLFLAWVIFNANFTLEICIFGVIIAAVMFAFCCKFADYSVQQEINNYKRVWKFLKYVFFLVKEIIKANGGVIRLILTQKEEVVPVVAAFHSDLKTPTAKAFLANAITLTPGTITVSLEGSEYTVHCLDEDMAEGLAGSDFEKKLGELENIGTKH